MKIYKSNWFLSQGGRVEGRKCLKIQNKTGISDMIDENTSNILMASFNDDEATHVFISQASAQQGAERNLIPFL